MIRNKTNLIELFLKNKQPDHKGRYLIDYWSYDDFQLEHMHDYIQWMFPLDTYSKHCISAPKLTKECALTIANDEQIRENMIKSYHKMMHFYGFSIMHNENNNVILTLANDFHIRVLTWGNSGNHNHLRLTRIMRCMYLMDMDDYAQALLTILKDLHHNGQLNATKQTLQHWSAYKDEHF